MTVSITEKFGASDCAAQSPVTSEETHSTSLNINNEVIGAVVSSIFQISKDQIYSRQRGKASVALARQIAMYLTHITCGYSYTDIGYFFGRDRTTVSHACQLIEDKREDPDIDWSLDLMEHSILSLINNFQERNG